MLYKAKFTGRKLHASGVFYEIEDTVEAEDQEQARLRLYDRYQDIMKLELTPLEPSEQAPAN